MNPDIEYSVAKPDEALHRFVDSFWLLRNRSEENKELAILPDGRIDLLFSQSATEPFHVILLGIGVQPEEAVLPADAVIFAVSFKLLAAEYILHDTVSPFLDGAKNLPLNFWNFGAADLDDFEACCKKAAQQIKAVLPASIDNRKQTLFDLIYSSNGSLPVKELAERSFWSSRQINRYFQQQYGLSLKAYCSILRFRASFPQIKQGKLFPEQAFADQSHFIREVKKHAGVLPKDLSKNKNGRFVQFSVLGRK